MSAGLDPKLLAILACPEDKGPLWYFDDEQILYNPRLMRAYEIADGIPVMLVDEARTVDAAEHERLMAKASSQGLRPTFEAPGDTGSPGGAGPRTGGEPRGEPGPADG